MLAPAHPERDDPHHREKKEQHRKDRDDQRRQPGRWGFVRGSGPGDRGGTARAASAPPPASRKPVAE